MNALYVSGSDDCINKSLESWSSNPSACSCSQFCLNGDGNELLFQDETSLQQGPLVV